MSARSTFLALALVTACAGAASTAKPPVAPPVPDTWLTSLDAASPLVGKAWEAGGHSLATRDRAATELVAARFALLGEKHDNPDHHRLQAAALDAIVAHGRHPAVLFEMIDLDLQPAIDAYLARPDATVDGLGRVLEWEKRGWPEWSLYRPIFEVAVAAHLKIFATGLGHEMIRAVVKQGIGALPPELASRLHLERPLPPELEASLDEELKASHCGFLPDGMVAPMSLAQRVKDALMADLMLGRDTPDGAVLIAGNGHVRTDRGVPLYLRAAKPDARPVSISFVEVEHGASDPAAYAADQPADYLVFTPRLDDDDPCAEFQHPK
ncbi:MAG TPA: ChaN family lipoprotein [Polyangiaceae bacterium]